MSSTILILSAIVGMIVSTVSLVVAIVTLSRNRANRGEDRCEKHTKEMNERIDEVRADQDEIRNNYLDRFRELNATMQHGFDNVTARIDRIIGSQR